MASLVMVPRQSAEQHSVSLKTSLSPLPEDLQRGLTAVSVFAVLSFVSAALLLGLLVYRLIIRRSLHRNQFFILILNLLVADIEQSIAFWLNITWLRLDAIHVGSSTCWAQGFFVSIGDLSSGVFTLLIALHTFADIVADIHLSHYTFLSVIAAGHIFVWACALIGIAMHPSDIYVRAGAWCWINGSYESLRLWLHYFFILIAEFGTMAIYTLLFVILRRRIKGGYYTHPSTARRAAAAAKAIIPYPVVYVICTLPLAAARISSMAGNTPTYATLTLAAAMITSNGWLDVLLYGFTRRALIFGTDDAAPDMRALDTFVWHGEEAFGTTTTIAGGGRKSRIMLGGSMEDLVENGVSVKTRTEVAVHSAPVEMRSWDRRESDGKESWMRDD